MRKNEEILGAGKKMQSTSGEIDIARKEGALDFFKWYIMKMNNFIFYFREVWPLTTSEEIENKITEFEGQTLDNLYAIFQKETETVVK